MSEERRLADLIIRHCAPTLANLKTANLFGYRYDTADSLARALGELAAELAPRGIRFRVLHDAGQRALIYVYRAGGWQRTFPAPRLRHCWPTADTAAMAARPRWTAWPGGLRQTMDSFRMKSGCFWVIRSVMSRDLSKTKAETANAPAAGRSTATNARPGASLAGLRSAEPSTAGCIGRAGPCPA